MKTSKSLFFIVDNVIKSFISLSQLGQIRFKNNVPLKLGDVNGNTDLVIFLLVNLIENALAYVSPQGFVEVGADLKAKNLEVWVRNDGNGIPQDQQALVFDRQYQLKNCQLKAGLGLSAARRILNQYGGKLWVEGERGKGNIFVFTIPNHD
jgi:signal transduction histidine kinase